MLCQPYRLYLILIILFYLLFIKISFPSALVPGYMSTSPILTSPTHNLQSTQEALNMLRNLREKRKKQNPATIYELVKDIHALLKDSTSKKGGEHETLSSEDYLGNRESIEGMLIFIKNKITERHQLNRNSSLEQRPCECENKAAKIAEETLQQCLAKKNKQIQQLNQAIKSSQQQSKSLQIKLLNNIKRLSVQIQEKETQLAQATKLLAEKQNELDEITKLNQKQHRKIRKIEEDMYDLQLQLEQKNEELEAERQCADYLEKKVAKLLDKDSHQLHHDYQEDTPKSSEFIQLEQRPHLIGTNSNIEDKSQIGTQTDISSPHSSGPTSEQNNCQTEQAEIEDRMSQSSSILTESKQSKYIESIQRLTMELGQAYQRINQLMKGEEPIDYCKTVEMITCDNNGLESDRRAKNMVNVGSQANTKAGKSKSRSGYFSKFWK